VDLVTITDLAHHPTEAVLGFEQHGFGVAVLRVRCEPAVEEPAYFPPCTADPDLAQVLLPDGWLTHGALIEAARVYLRCSGEWGPVRGGGEDVCIRYWTPQPLRSPDVPASNDAARLHVFLCPEGEMACEVTTDWQAERS
jgi:hypothetical protein